MKERFYIFNYLQNSKNHLLITDAGVDSHNAKLCFQTESLSIKVETFKHLYKLIFQNLINIIQRIEIKEVDTFSCISLFSNYSEPIKGHDIRKKIEE